jgi:hypothetical protein
VAGGVNETYFRLYFDTALSDVFALMAERRAMVHEERMAAKAAADAAKKNPKNPRQEGLL